MSKQLYQKECIICGKTFTASRFDAKYCSPRCGQLAYKQAQGETIPTPEPRQPMALGAAPAAAPIAAPAAAPKEPKEAAPQTNAPVKLDLLDVLAKVERDKKNRDEIKSIMKDAFREIMREETENNPSPQRPINVHYKDTPLSALNLMATGVDIAMGKSDSNDIKSLLNTALANQKVIYDQQSLILKVVQTVQMDVKAIKRALKIFHITAEYSPKHKQYLFTYRQGNMIIKEDVNGKILESVGL